MLIIMRHDEDSNELKLPAYNGREEAHVIISKKPTSLEMNKLHDSRLSHGSKPKGSQLLPSSLPVQIAGLFVHKDSHAAQNRIVTSADWRRSQLTHSTSFKSSVRLAVSAWSCSSQRLFYNEKREPRVISVGAPGTLLSSIVNIGIPGMCSSQQEYVKSAFNEGTRAELISRHSASNVREVLVPGVAHNACAFLPLELMWLIGNVRRHGSMLSALKDLRGICFCGPNEQTVLRLSGDKVRGVKAGLGVAVDVSEAQRSKTTGKPWRSFGEQVIFIGSWAATRDTMKFAIA